MRQRAYRHLYASWLRVIPDLGDRRVLAAGAAVGVFAALTQVATLAKDLAVAGTFGTSDAIDAFLIAFLLPSYAINVLGATIASAFIPTYVQARERDGPEAASRLYGSVLTFSVGLLLVTAALLAVGFPYLVPLLASGFTPEKLALTTTLFHALLPVLVLAALVWIWSAVLNAEGSFAWASAATMAVPLAILAAVLTFSHVGVIALALGVVVGTLIQCGVLATAMRQRNIPVVPRWHGRSEGFHVVLGQYAPLIIGSLLTGGTAIIDTSMAAMLPSGSVATLNYGSKVVLGILNIGTVALGTAVLPHFALFVARGEWEQLRQSLSKYTCLVLLVSIPGTIALVLVSQWIIQLLFERGAFTAADTASASVVQVAFAVQIPFMLAGTLYVRVLSSMRRARVLMWGSTITLPLNVILNLVFSRYLGVAGIALSTSLVIVVSFTYLRIMTLRLLPPSVPKAA